MPCCDDPGCPCNNPACPECGEVLFGWESADLCDRCWEAVREGNDEKVTNERAV
jgi:hypothetical protein